jgi:hypothetical protein
MKKTKADIVPIVFRELDMLRLDPDGMHIGWLAQNLADLELQ